MPGAQQNKVFYGLYKEKYKVFYEKQKPPPDQSDHSICYNQDLNIITIIVFAVACKLCQLEGIYLIWIKEYTYTVRYTHSYGTCKYSTFNPLLLLT